MRMWHYSLFSALPTKQLKGQLRELVYIFNKVRYGDSPNHLLVNRVQCYPLSDLYDYFSMYRKEYKSRFNKDIDEKIVDEFSTLSSNSGNCAPYKTWMNKEYLRVCMSNLYEKARFGMGESQVTPNEWIILVERYKQITGEAYRI